MGEGVVGDQGVQVGVVVGITAKLEAPLCSDGSQLRGGGKDLAALRAGTQFVMAEPAERRVDDAVACATSAEAEVDVVEVNWIPE